MTEWSKRAFGDFGKGGAQLGTSQLTSTFSQKRHQQTTLTHLGIALENTKFLKRLEQKFGCMSHSALLCAIIQNTHCGFATSPI